MPAHERKSLGRRSRHGSLDHSYRHRRTAARLRRALLQRWRFAGGLALTLICAVIAVPVIAGVVWKPGGGGTPEPEPISKVPPDNPRLGLVYEGLTPAGSGTPCVGAYQVATADVCSHGPDGPPPGLAVHRAVAPVATSSPAPTLPRTNAPTVPDDTVVWRDVGAVTDEPVDTPAPAGGGPAAAAPAARPAIIPAAPAGAAGPGGIACDGDGVSGKRVQVLYVYQAGTVTRYSQYLGSFRAWAAGVDTIYSASAAETGGSRHVRYVTTPDCQVAVTEVEVPAGALATFNATITVLQSLGYNRADRKYLIFAEADVYCGIGTFISDQRAGQVNHSNDGPSYGRSDAGCWSPPVAAQELAHNLGAVGNGAPHSDAAGHCTDGYDLMCTEPTAATQGKAGCADRARAQRLDCNHDDYFNTSPRPGSYLATHWNVADSEFLVSDGGAGEGTFGPVPLSASPTAPAGTGTDGVGSAGSLVPLRVGAATGTAVTIGWDSAGAGVRYGILVNDRSAGSTTATAAQVIGLRPDTAYAVQVVALDSDRVTRPYTARAPVRTAGVRRPAAGTWFVLGNALTGDVADLYAARSANGAPLVLQPRTDGADQQWQLQPADDGTFQLRSRATGKCLAPRGGTPTAGAPLVQQSCAAGPAVGQRWQISSTAYGFALVAADNPDPTGGALVIGAGQPRYNGQRLLVLQHATTQARHQSWTALAG